MMIARAVLAASAFCGFFWTTSLGADDAVLRNIVEHAAKHPDGDAPFSFDAAAYRSADLSSLPIGVFDSGIGGLTVLEAILALDAFDNVSLQPGADGIPDFKDEKIIYFGDQANMPYGNYSAVGRTDYLRELVLKDAVFLLGKRYHAGGAVRLDKPPVKAIVIACNTATAYGLEDIRQALKAWNIPVIVVGVVEAGARGVRESRAPEDTGAIGVLATVGTCASGAYPRLIGQVMGLAGRTVPPITQQGSPSLAGVIEGDPAFPQSLAHQTMEDVRDLVETHKRSGAAAPLRTVVLGCTHFPLAKAEIDAAFAKLRQTEDYHGAIGNEITYVNPAEWTARELFRELAKATLRLPPAKRAALSRHQFFLSTPNPASPAAQLSSEGGLQRDYKYGREAGRLDLEDTVNIPLRAQDLPAVSRNLVEKKLPLVWEALQNQ
jgi:glutamate racemase